MAWVATHKKTLCVRMGESMHVLCTSYARAGKVRPGRESAEVCGFDATRSTMSPKPTKYSEDYGTYAYVPPDALAYYWSESGELEARPTWWDDEIRDAGGVRRCLD